MSWYCLKLRSNREFEADKFLKSQGFWHYLPVIQKDKRKKFSGRDCYPMYKGYSFIYLEPGKDDFAKVIENSRVINDFIRCGNEPVKLTEATIELVRQTERDVIPPEDYIEGDMVKVKFSGHGLDEYRDAIFKCKNGKERADVLLVMIGKTRVEAGGTINVQIKDIEPA